MILVETRSACAVAILLVCVFPGGAKAQLQLSGVAHKASVHARKPPIHAERAEREGIKPIPVPSEDAVLGQTLTYDGAKGMMRFNRDGKNIVLSRLTLPGEKLSKPGEYCEVDIKAEHPVAAIMLGRPEGAIRWSFPLEACPFTADVLDGAVLVSSPHPNCDFKAADCRVSAVGIWGPPGDAIPSQQIESLADGRHEAEAALRANFKVIIGQAGSDKEAVKAIVAEEEAFPAERETTCRDYKGEAEHGFCAAQITRAQSLAVMAEYSARLADETALKAAEAAKRAEEAAKKAAEDAKKAAENAQKAAERAKLNAAKEAAKAQEAARQEAARKETAAPATSVPALVPVISPPLNLLPKDAAPAK
jgi:hypothetical protein